MPARERSGYKGGVGIFSYDLMVSWKWWDNMVQKRIIKSGQCIVGCNFIFMFDIYQIFY